MEICWFLVYTVCNCHMAEINKKSLEHLAKLARIELHAQEEEKLLTDLEKILDHFKELGEVNTEDVPGMTGGTELKSVFRTDETRKTALSSDLAREAFPEKEQGFLKIPPVFE